MKPHDRTRDEFDDQSVSVSVDRHAGNGLAIPSDGRVSRRGSVRRAAPLPGTRVEPRVGGVIRVAYPENAAGCARSRSSSRCIGGVQLGLRGGPMVRPPARRRWRSRPDGCGGRGHAAAHRCRNRDTRGGTSAAESTIRRCRA